jgi:hypothetical protein
MLDARTWLDVVSAVDQLKGSGRVETWISSPRTHHEHISQPNLPEERTIIKVQIVSQEPERLLQHGRFVYYDLGNVFSRYRP